ncbi:hypothetical protein F5B19DRAFT_241936 [Rostrohypoxylon terebratum]|nr:hypothetical protein F5B19DRAFT_241936 [Rostrohypoxylon terebratum]
MESVFLSSVSLGILVEKEIMVRIEDKANGDLAPSYPSSVVSAVRSISNLTRGTKKSEMCETISSLPSGKMLARPNVSEDCRRELVEFFHGPPPKGNFMSIPDDASISSVDGKWSALKVFRKKRKRRKRRQPPLIRLPDSAVSARTIDGHRYIAISIPINYSDYSPVPFQRPTADRLTHRSTPDPLRNNLHTVTEDQESVSTISLTTKSAAHQEGFTELAPPPREVSLLPTIHSQASQEEINSGKGKEFGTLEIGTARQALMTPLKTNKLSDITDQESKSPSRERALQLEQPKKASISTLLETDKFPRLIDVTPKKIKSAEGNEPSAHENIIVPKNNSKGASKSAEPSHSTLAKLLNVPALPTRTSSKTATVTSSGRSCTSDRRPMLSTANSYNYDGNGRTTGPCASVAESLRTPASSPRLLSAQTATAYQSVPIVIQPPDHLKAESPLNLNFPTPPSGTSIRANSDEQVAILSPPAVAKVVSNRKERVRERKQKDIEKLKAQLRQSETSASETSAGSDSPESPVLGRFSSDVGLSSSKSYLTSKMAEIGPTRQRLDLKSPDLSPEAVSKKRRGRSSSVPLIASSSSASSPDSPTPLEGSTAHYRRRERQAERDENEARTRREKYVAQALVEEAEFRDQIMRHKLPRRYEKLKEIRLKDMEKRLHRLEQNGELLMQSMVSLTDTLSKILQDQHQIPIRRSAPARTASTSSRQSRRMYRESLPQRAQSLRSIRSYDMLRETIRTTAVPNQISPNPDLAGQEGDTKGKRRVDVGTLVSASDLEALRLRLQSHSRQIADISSQARDSSSDKSTEVESVTRELQEEAETSYTDTEMLHFF